MVRPDDKFDDAVWRLSEANWLSQFVAWVDSHNPSPVEIAKHVLSLIQHEECSPEEENILRKLAKERGVTEITVCPNDPSTVYIRWADSGPAHYVHQIDLKLESPIVVDEDE